MTQGPYGWYGLHLESYRDPDSAERGWLELLELHPEILYDKNHIVIQVDLGSKGIYYRIITGPFQSEDEALFYRQKLKAKGQYAEVMPFPDPVYAKPRQELQDAPEVAEAPAPKPPPRKSPDPALEGLTFIEFEEAKPVPHDRFNIKRMELPGGETYHHFLLTDPINGKIGHDFYATFYGVNIHHHFMSQLEKGLQGNVLTKPLGFSSTSELTFSHTHDFWGFTPELSVFHAMGVGGLDSMTRSYKLRLLFSGDNWQIVPRVTYLEGEQLFIPYLGFYLTY